MHFVVLDDVVLWLLVRVEGKDVENGDLGDRNARLGLYAVDEVVGSVDPFLEL